VGFVTAAGQFRRTQRRGDHRKDRDAAYAKGAIGRRPSETEEWLGREGRLRPISRGFAASPVALVVLFHAGLLSNASTQITGGFIGVDLFFVVSGYLITGLLIRSANATAGSASPASTPVASANPARRGRGLA